MRNLVDGYFLWLLDMVHYEEQPIYWRIMDILFQRPFTFKMYMDHNRESDGRKLRQIYAHEVGIDYYQLEQECMANSSILEMMIALANRIEYDNMHDEDLGDRTPLWFWGMIDSLGLSNFDDYRFDLEMVNGIVDIFLDRKYERNGNGGLFTIRNSHIDMRREELWYQAQYFLEENYD